MKPFPPVIATAEESVDFNPVPAQLKRRRVKNCRLWLADTKYIVD